MINNLIFRSFGVPSITWKMFSVRSFCVGLIVSVAAFAFSRRNNGPFTVSSSEFPFDTEKTISSKAIGSIKITSCGRSLNPEFADSLFECKKGDGDSWIVVRRQRGNSSSVQIPLCEEPGNLTLESQGLNFLKTASEEKIPIYAIKQIPKVFGSGAMGQVYKISLPDKRISIVKIKRTHVGVHAGVAFAPVRLGGNVTPLSLEKMSLSFKDSAHVFRESRNFLNSPQYAKCYGLVYVQELNVWAVAYEFLEGEYPNEYSNNPELGKKIFTSIAEGLKLLDEQRAPYTDLTNHNILIGKDGMAMFFDDVYTRVEKDEDWIDYSKKSKCEFAHLLSAAFTPERTKELDQDIKQMIRSCNDMNWDEIISILKSDKELSRSESSLSSIERAVI